MLFKSYSAVRYKKEATIVPSFI